MKFAYPITLFSAAAVLASPVKRQTSTVVAVVTIDATPASEPTSTASTRMASVDTTMSMATLASGPPAPSSASSAKATSTSSSSDDDESNAAYPCPSDYLLTYVSVQETYDNSLREVLSYTSSFTNATWLQAINGTGGNRVGATRYLGGPGLVRKEVLDSYGRNTANVSLQYIANLTNGPISLSAGSSLSNYTTVLQVYTNTSASTQEMNATTVKLYCNFCASNQQSGMMDVRSSLTMALANLGTLLGGTSGPGMPGVVPSGAMPSGAMPSGVIVSMGPGAAPSGMPVAGGPAGASSNGPSAPSADAPSAGVGAAGLSMAAGPSGSSIPSPAAL